MVVPGPVSQELKYLCKILINLGLIAMHSMLQCIKMHSHMGDTSGVMIPGLEPVPEPDFGHF